jgi:hypothetical protein
VRNGCRCPLFERPSQLGSFTARNSWRLLPLKKQSGTGSLTGPASLLRPEGLEPPTPGSEDRYSIQLSYGRMRTIVKPFGLADVRRSFAARNSSLFSLSDSQDFISPSSPGEFRCAKLVSGSELRVDGSADELVRARSTRGGATGLEPATPRTTTWCADRLRHAPHVSSGTPGRIRTSGQRLRRPLLCPLSYGRMRTIVKPSGLPMYVGVSLRETPVYRLSDFQGLNGPWRRASFRRLAVARTRVRSRLRSAPASRAERATSVCVGRYLMSIAIFRIAEAASNRPKDRMERETGIEPASLAWKARALPLSYSRSRRGRIRTGDLSVPNAAR